MVNITLCEVYELETITGLTYEELQKNGFHLEDCEAVAIIDEKNLPVKLESDNFGFTKWVPKEDLFTLYYEGKISSSLYDLLISWENYGLGSYYVKYKNKVYVSKHHI